MDKGHQLTDDILENLEKDLIKTYSAAFKSAKKKLETINTTLSKYKDTMTESDRLNLWNQKNRLDKLLTTLTIEIADANITAVKMLNDELINVFDLNYSYGAYTVENLSGYEVYANLYNRNTIKKLLADNENPFTMIAIDEIKDKTTIYNLLKRQFTTAIINGESIDKIAKRVQQVMESNGSRANAIARTETTRLEALGRQDAFKKGEEMGLKLKKKWISTIDPRTRESHLSMQGETVGLDEKFSNGLDYPGGMGGKASEVVNCRCSHVVEFEGVEKSTKLKELESDIKKMSYEEWTRRFDK